LAKFSLYIHTAVCWCFRGWLDTVWWGSCQFALLLLVHSEPLTCSLVPWLQERWTSSFCKRVSLCPRSRPVKHGPGTRALGDLLGIQMASAAQGKWQP